MLHSYTTINENSFGWKNETTLEHPNDNNYYYDDDDLSPQVIRTTIDGSTIKGVHGDSSDRCLGQEEFERKNPSDFVGEQSDNNNGETCFIFENMYSVLAQMEKVQRHTPGTDTSKSVIVGCIISSDIRIEDEGEMEEDEGEGEMEEDDGKSISSSTYASTFFGFFEDLSQLTDDNSYTSMEYDTEYSEIDMHVITEITSFPTESYSDHGCGGTNLQVDRKDTSQDSQEDCNETGISDEWKGLSLLNLIVESSHENGFSPNDELRMG